MKIDTTATILQLSSALAASAGVATPSSAEGDDLQASAVVTTSSANPNPSLLSFLQLLTQAQQVAASPPPTTGPGDDSGISGTDSPPKQDVSGDPASISNALLAFLSQSTQPVPANSLVTPQSTVETTQQPVQAIEAAPQTGTAAVPTVAVDCPKVLPQIDSPDHGTESNVKVGETEPSQSAKAEPELRSQDIKPASSTLPSAVEKTIDPNAKIDLSGLPRVPQSSEAAPVPTVGQEATALTATVTEKTNNVVAGVTNSTSQHGAQITDSQPGLGSNEIPSAPLELAQGESILNGATPKVVVAEVPAEKSAVPTVRRPQNQSFEPVTSSAVAERHVDFSNPNSILNETTESSQASTEPMTKVTEEPKPKKAESISSVGEIPAEAMHAVGESSSVVDSTSHVTTVDAHSLAHHLESMVMQRLDQPEPTDKSSVVLRLDPPKLGRVNVHMSVSNDVVSIHMVTADDGARQVIERQLSELQQSLSDRGIAFQDFQVTTGGSGQQSPDRGFRKHWADNSGYSTFSGRRTSSSTAIPSVRSGILAQLNYVA